MENHSLQHIVLLTDCLENLMGGAEKQVFQLAQGLDKSRYHVTVVSLECEGEAPVKIFTSIGCDLKIFPVSRIYGFSGLREGRQFLKFLKAENVQLVLTYHFSSDIWGTFWAKKADVPVIISNRRDMGFWRDWKHILAYRWINRDVTKVIAVAKAVKEQIVYDEGVFPEKIAVIYNGVGPMDAQNPR